MTIKAQSDVGIELWQSDTGSAASYSKLIDITSLPAMGAAKQKIDATVMSDDQERSIAGRKTTPDMDFEYFYEATNFAAVVAICDSPTYLMAVYGDGSGVVIAGEGNTWQNSVGLNAGVKATLHFVPSSIDFKTAAEVTALKSGS